MLDGVFMLPLGVSAVTVGFGFLITLDRPRSTCAAPALLVPIAQAMVALPLVVRTVGPVLRSVDDRQRQAAASLGAGPLRVLLTVDLPRPGGRCSLPRASPSPSRSVSSGRPASSPATTDPRCRW